MLAEVFGVNQTETYLSFAQIRITNEIIFMFHLLCLVNFHLNSVTKGFRSLKWWYCTL